MIKEEEKAITDANNITTDTFSPAFSPHRENMNARFAIEKLENSNELVNTVVNTRIKDAGYELNPVTMSDTKVEFSSDPDGINHTKNRITHQNLLSSRIIGVQHEEVSVLTLPKAPRIGANNQPALSISTGATDARFTWVEINVHRRGFEQHGDKHESTANYQDWR